MQFPLDEPHAQDEPTSAMPGTAEKIEVLRRRNEKGMVLWNPNDSREIRYNDYPEEMEDDEWLDQHPLK